MSVLVLDGVVWMGGVSARCECMLLYLAKKLKSIAGHKECVGVSIVRQEPCERCVRWGGSMASTISLIDRVSKRGLFFNKPVLREKKNNQ